MRDWDDYRYVTFVARHGSLSAAARALGVHHSTVFRRIAAVEASTGVRLFDRLPEGYVPTAEGAAVIDELERVESSIHAVERRLTGADSAPGGRVRVTTTEDVVHMLVEPHLATFHAVHPKIRLEITISNRFFNLSRREAEIAIRPGRDPEGDMVGRRVARITMAVYAAPAYLEAHGRPDRDVDLPRHQLVTCDDSLSHLAIARWMRRFENGDNVALSSNSFLVQLGAARAGLGVAVLPLFMAVDGGLEMLWPLDAELASELWLLTHRDLRRTPRIRAVLDYFYAAFTAERARLERRA